MPAWPLRSVGSATDGDWFAQRFAHARKLVPAAEFDTIIPVEFAEGITTELVNVVGVADASTANVNGGAIQVTVGDAVIAPSSGLLQLTGTSAHVSDLAAKPWYMAALVRAAVPPFEDQIGDTRLDAVALRADADNGVALGVFGDASGGSTTKWVGSVTAASSTTTVLGPTFELEGPVYHLFESWVGGGVVHFMIDGVEFDDTIDAANLPSLGAALGMLIRRDAIGDPAFPFYEKACVVVRSPPPGSI